MSRVWLSRNVRDQLVAEAEERAPLETGGVIMGYHAGDDVVITAMIGPGPGAHHERNTFVPDHEYQEVAIATVYQHSGRVWTYLGDWHSHPNGGSQLSTRDRQTMRRIARSRTARARTPLMLLLSGGDEWHVTVHRANLRGWLLDVRTIPPLLYD